MKERTVEQLLKFSDKNAVVCYIQGMNKGRGEYAGMDDCHARYQHYADHTGHGKNYFSRKSAGYRRTAVSAGGPSSEREGGEVCGIFSETGRYFLWNAISQYKNLVKTRYVNDKQITDHYAIIPTGQGLSALSSVSQAARNVYDCVVKRFLSIFYPPAVYQKVAVTVKIREESFFSNFKVLAEEGYLKVAGIPQNAGEQSMDPQFFQVVQNLKKGAVLPVCALDVKEGETSPPKRYNSGSMILAMENAGQLIEDEELRAQIKGSGIGTSATRAEILKKLIHIKYLSLNKKTQIITPTLQGEMVYDVVNQSIRSLLNPELTASWEKGLTYVADGEITPDEYMQKLDHFIISRTEGVKRLNNQYQLKGFYDAAAKYYKKPVSSNRTSRKKEN